MDHADKAAEAIKAAKQAKHQISQLGYLTEAMAHIAKQIDATEADPLTDIERARAKRAIPYVNQAISDATPVPAMLMQGHHAEADHMLHDAQCMVDIARQIMNGELDAQIKCEVSAA